MTNPMRCDLPRALEELSAARPEDRFGQMIANLACLARGDSGGAIWGMDDEEPLAAARKHLADWKERHASVA